MEETMDKVKMVTKQKISSMSKNLQNNIQNIYRTPENQKDRNSKSNTAKDMNGQFLEEKNP